MNRARGCLSAGVDLQAVRRARRLETGLLRRDEVIQCTGEEVIDGQIFPTGTPTRTSP